MRRKAYELWEQGGRVDGADQADWFAAEASLSSPEPSRHAEPEPPHRIEPEPSRVAEAATSVPDFNTVTQAVTDGIQTAASIATGAIQAITDFFVPPDPAKSPQATDPDETHPGPKS